MKFSEEHPGYKLYRCECCDYSDKTTKDSGLYKVYYYNYKLYLVCKKCGKKTKFSIIL